MNPEEDRAEKPGPSPRDASIALLIALLAILAVPGTLGTWFTHDDFFHFRWVARHTPVEILGGREAMRELPNKMVTPLYFLSVDIDHQLAGWDARPYRIHQLVSWATFAAALYLTLRLWRTRFEALAASAIGILHPALNGLVPFLITRHYLEGLILALAATATWTVAVRRSASPVAWSVVSALSYAGAMLAKEVFVPLPLVLLSLPEGGWRRRLRSLAPHAIAFIAYLLYRRWLLEEWFGGYGWALDSAPAVEAVLRLPLALVELVARPAGVAGWTLAAVTGVLVAGLAWRQRRLRPAVLAAVVAVLGPLAPVAFQPEPRWAAVGWVLLLFGLAAAVAACPRAWRAGVWAGLLVVAVAGHFVNWPRTVAGVRRIDTENRAFLSLDAGDQVRHPASPAAALVELAAFKSEVLNLGAGPAWFADDFYLCVDDRLARTTWEYDAALESMVDRTRAVQALAVAHCATWRRETPLSARFDWRAGRLRWTLGPHAGGAYRFLLGDGTASVRVPAQGGFRRPSGPFSIRVRYDAPDGWSTYSESIDLAPDRSADWSRGIVSAGGY